MSSIPVRSVAADSKKEDPAMRDPRAIFLGFEEDPMRGSSIVDDS